MPIQLHFDVEKSWEFLCLSIPGPTSVWMGGNWRFTEPASEDRLLNMCWGARPRGFVFLVNSPSKKTLYLISLFTGEGFHSTERAPSACVNAALLPEFFHSFQTLHFPDHPGHSHLMDHNPLCGQNRIYLQYNSNSSVSENSHRMLSGTDGWSLRACHFRHHGVCSPWQPENNNRLHMSWCCRGEPSTNQPSLSQIRVSWLFLYDLEHNIKRLGCTSWNRTGSKYEMGSQRTKQLRSSDLVLSDCCFQMGPGGWVKIRVVYSVSKYPLIDVKEPDPKPPPWKPETAKQGTSLRAPGCRTSLEGAMRRE